jgi:branched-chain amino acid transport system substrate-binding protein
MSIRRLPTIVLGLALALAPAFAPIRAQGADPIVIPVITALTGSFAILGKTQQQSLQIYEKTLNAKGGVDGRPLQFDFLDDASNPATSVQLMNQLIARQVQLVIGPSSVATCRAVGPLVAASGPVQYCMSPGAITTKGGYVFAASYTTYDAIRTAFNYFRVRGWKRIAMLEPTDATGQDGEEQFDKVLALPENQGETLIAREHYNIGDISAAAQIARIKALNPDVLYCWTTGIALATVLHGLKDAGYDVPAYSSHGNMLYTSMEQFGDLAPKAGLYFIGPQFIAQQFLPRGPDRVAVENFLNAFKANGVRPDNAHAAEWDVALVVTEALRRTGPNASADKIRDAIEQIHGLAGAEGTFDFRDGSQRGIGAATILAAKWDPTVKDFVAVSAPGGKPLPR